MIAVQFKEGPEVPADLVVMAAGIRPNTELALKMGLYCGPQKRRGIVVADTMQTVTDPRIYSVGERAAGRAARWALPVLAQHRPPARPAARHEPHWHHGPPVWPCARAGDRTACARHGPDDGQGRRPRAGHVAARRDSIIVPAKASEQIG